MRRFDAPYKQYSFSIVDVVMKFAPNLKRYSTSVKRSPALLGWKAL